MSEIIKIYLDIETIPSQNPSIREAIEASISPPRSMKKAETIEKWELNEKPAAVEEAWRKTALDGSFGEVWCIAWAINDGPINHITRTGLNDPEGSILPFFFESIHEEAPMPDYWIGHNIRSFDLRFLWQRAVILGVAPTINLYENASPYEKAIIDTMTMWAGYRNFIGLEKLCTALGIPRKSGMDGSQVWDYVKAGRIAEVAGYCRDDVKRVRSVYKKLMFQV